MPRKTYIIPLCNLFDICNNLIARSRVKATCGLVEEEDFGRSDQLAGNTDPSLLASTNALADWRAYEGVLLPSQAEGVDERVDSSDAVFLGQSTR